MTPFYTNFWSFQHHFLPLQILPISYIVPFVNIQDTNTPQSTKQWFVVHTQTCQEMLALQHLLDQRFDAYLPRFKKIRRHARKVNEVLAPLFPRYLFVGIDLAVDLWRSINGTRGVAYLLTNAGQPLWIPDAIVEDLKAQEDANGVVPISILDRFAPGDRVRVKEGAFEGQTAIVEQWTDQARVAMLLNFLGRDTRITLPAYVIEAA